MHIMFENAEILSTLIIDPVVKTALPRRKCKLANDAKQILEEKNAGASIRQLAKKWNTSTSTILRALKLAAIPSR